MARRALRIALAVVLLAILLVSLGGASRLGAAAPTPGGVHASDSLTVTVGSAFSFAVSTDEVTPGDTVTLEVVQTDDVAHTFTLSSVRNATIPTTDSAAELAAYFTAHPPLVNVTIPAGQATLTTSFVAPPVGVYEFVCLAPGHFQAGMSGLLGSGVAPSGSTTAPTGPGWQVFVIGGTIAALVVLALVLGFVLGRREGSVHEMPPERLGYPEPATPAGGPGAPPSPP